MHYLIGGCGTFFKRINDEYGQWCRWFTPCELGRIIREAASKGRPGSRWGGEGSFLVAVNAIATELEKWLFNLRWIHNRQESRKNWVFGIFGSKIFVWRWFFWCGHNELEKLTGVLFKENKPTRGVSFVYVRTRKMAGKSERERRLSYYMNDF